MEKVFPGIFEADQHELVLAAEVACGLSDVVAIVWQGGHASTATCDVKSGELSIVFCTKLTPAVTIGQGRPATLEVRYLAKDHQQLNKICSPRQCVSVDDDPILTNISRLDVRAEGSSEVELWLPFTVGLV